MLEAAGQPIWVVDRAGLIRFANPAALAALGYDSADELFGRHSHETIHYQHPDGTPYPAAECPMLLPRTTGEVVKSDLDWFFRRDGSMFPVSYVSVPLEMPDGRGAVVAFTDIEDRLRAEQVLREHDSVLAAREGSLRRIATLVAGGAASGEVFAAIAREVAQVLGMALVVIWRYDPDGPASVLGAWSDRPHPFQTGTSWPVEERTAAALLPEIGRPTRIEDFGEIGGAIPDAIRETGIRSGTGAAIIVDGEFWGVMGAGVAEGRPLREHIEDRLVEFTELVATAISSSEARSDLAASRARIVATTDETRRRFERDLHDGVQQRLVSLSLGLVNTEALAPPGHEQLRRQLAGLREGLAGVLDDLRELSRGIHPAILSEGGLDPALKALVRRSAIPVKLDVSVDNRLDQRVEVAAYYVVSEALANAAKHAQASVVEVHVEARNGTLDLAIRDDGIGGADPSRGSGLIGLSDRVEALGGTIGIVSPAGEGTTLHAQLPIDAC